LIEIYMTFCNKTVYFYVFLKIHQTCFFILATYN